MSDVIAVSDVINLRLVINVRDVISEIFDVSNWMTERCGKCERFDECK